MVVLFKVMLTLSSTGIGAKYADPTTSPIFNGDAHSMGGQGESIKHSGYSLGMMSVIVPPGKGDGCVQTGPFAKYVARTQTVESHNLSYFSMSVNVGPVASSVDTTENIPRNPRDHGYGYDPRCLRRDVNSYFTSQFLRPIDIANHINSTSDMLTFENTFQTDTAKAV